MITSQRRVTRAVLVVLFASLAPSSSAMAKDPWPAVADRAKLVAAHETFESRARDARTFLADGARYPVPTGVFLVGKNTQVGHAQMERLVSASVAAHNVLQRDLCKALGLKTETVGAKKATLEPLDRDASVAEIYGVVLPLPGDFDRLIAACGKRLASARGKPQEADLPRLDRVLGELQGRAYEAAVSAMDGADPFERIVARAAFDHALRRHLEANDGGHDDNEMKGLRSLNAYRSALDLRPLIADEKVHAMARRFAEDQAKLNFFSHEHPSDPRQRTVQDRAKLAGYGGEVFENCATGGDGFQVVWAWRNDAGHHAPLVTERGKVVGLGCAGKSVLNVGIECDAPIAVLIRR